MRAALGGLLQPLSVIWSDHGCSSYFNTQPRALDRIVITPTMKEANRVEARIEGVCGAAKCKSIDAQELPAFRHVSDHCPVIIDLIDRDQDP